MTCQSVFCLMTREALSGVTHRPHACPDLNPWWKIHRTLYYCPTILLVCFCVSRNLVSLIAPPAPKALSTARKTMMSPLCVLSAVFQQQIWCARIIRQSILRWLRSRAGTGLNWTGIIRTIPPLQPQSASPAPSAPLRAALPTTQHQCSGCFFHNKSLRNAAVLQDIMNNIELQCGL